MSEGNETLKWAAIPDWPNYEISSEGQVRCLVGPGFAARKLRFPRFKKPHRAKDGYLRVSLHEKRGAERRVETWLVHRLVAICFVPGDHGLHVAHLNGRKDDNRASNLAWVTRIENESHKIIHGTRAEGSRNGQSRLNERMVKAIRDLHSKDGLSQRRLAERFGVCPQTISHIILGSTWDHVP